MTNPNTSTYEALSEDPEEFGINDREKVLEVEKISDFPVTYREENQVSSY